MKKISILLVSLVVIIFISSCGAPGQNSGLNTPSVKSGDVAGLSQGLWHGIIAPYSFIGSWFSDSVNIYEVHNNGFWYNLGFLFGNGMLMGTMVTFRLVRAGVDPSILSPFYRRF